MRKLKDYTKRQYALPQRHLNKLEEEAKARTCSVTDLVREAVAEHVDKAAEGPCVVCHKRKRIKGSWVCRSCIKEGRG